MADEAAVALDAKALQLRELGADLGKIAAQCGFSTPAQAKRAIERAQKRQGDMFDPVLLRRLEMGRLERIRQKVYAKAVNGDLEAAKEAREIGATLLRLAGEGDDAEGGVEAEFMKSVAALHLDDRDAGLVANGRSLARSIDALASCTDPQFRSKAADANSKLTPILRELGATPASRGEVVVAGVAARAVKAADAELDALMAE